MTSRKPWALLPLLLVLAACGRIADGGGSTGGGGGTGGTGSSGIEHPAGADELVLRVEYTGGFVPIDSTLRSIPSWTLYGDGTLVMQAPQIEIYPPPALPGLTALQAFEQQRDAMQLQAAIDRFEQGDYTGCESRLAALVARRPDFLAARLRLAEILWARGEIAQAEEHYHAVLSAEPANSEAHHGLGMLLEAEGRFEEAEPHLALAVAEDAATAAPRAPGAAARGR